MIIHTKTSTGGYDIVIERGSLDKVGELLNLNRKVLVVTDDMVPIQYAQKVVDSSSDPTLVILPHGEKTKCMDEYTHLLSVLLENSFSRSDCVVAVGGGVMGDLAGFAASTYMRGIDFYNIPTTVLSQVDSSVGGKVAIDLNGTKNIVGAFYPPKKVVIDPNVLSTLEPRHIANGLCEALKMSATFSSELFEVFDKQDPMENIDRIIEESIQMKSNIVELDEKESGIRKSLNFGHTIGHAVEASQGLDGLLHGECVGVGMLHMSADRARIKIERVLKKLGLPTDPKCDAEVMCDYLIHDKKASSDSIDIVWVEDVGSFEVRKIPLDTLIKYVKEKF